MQIFVNSVERSNSPVYSVPHGRTNNTIVTQHKVKMATNAEFSSTTDYDAAKYTVVVAIFNVTYVVCN